MPYLQQLFGFSKIFFVFFLLALTFLTNPAKADNECGLATPGGTVMCNGDGNPATDVANNTTGISYVIPFNNNITITLTNGIGVTHNGLNGLGAVHFFIDSGTIGNNTLNIDSGVTINTTGNNTNAIMYIPVGIGVSTLNFNGNIISEGGYGVYLEQIEPTGSVIANLNGDIASNNLMGTLYGVLINTHGDLTVNSNSNITLHAMGGNVGLQAYSQEANLNVTSNGNIDTGSGEMNAIYALGSNNVNSSSNLIMNGDIINGRIYFGGGASQQNAESIVGNINNGGLITDFQYDNSKITSNISGDIHSSELNIFDPTGILLLATSTTNLGNRSDIDIEGSSAITIDNGDGVYYQTVFQTNNLTIDGSITAKRWAIVQGDSSSLEVATSNITINGSITSVDGTAIHLGGRSDVFADLSGFNNDLNYVYNHGTINGSIIGQSSKDEINLYSSSVVNGDIDLGANNDTLNIEDGANINGVTLFDGGAATDSINFNNSNLTINMSLVQNWENYGFRGNNIILNGNLNNNSASGSVTIRNSTTPLVINGNYTQNAGNTLTFDALSNSNYGKLDVNGTATFANNTTINFNLLSGSTIGFGQVLSNVITSNNLILSDLNITDSSALYNFKSVINGTNVDFMVQSASPTTIFDSAINYGTSSSTGLAKVLDNFVNNGASNDMATVISAFGVLGSEPEIAKAAEQTTSLLSPEISYLTSSNNIFTNIVNDRVSTNQGFNSGDKLLESKTFWVKPFASLTKQDNQGNSRGYSKENYGIAFGGENEISNLTNLGLAFAISSNNTKSNSTAAKQEVDTDHYQMKLYGSYDFNDATLLTAQLGGGTSKYNSSRLINFGGLNRTAKAEYNGWNAQASLKLQRKFTVDKKSSVIPFFKTEYGYAAIDNYQENGADSINLHVDKTKDDTLLIGTGLKLLHNFSQNLSSSITTGIGYDLKSDRSRVTSSLTGGDSSFSTTGIKPDPLIYDLTLSSKYDINELWDISADYNLNARRDYIDHSLLMNFRMNF